VASYIACTAARLATDIIHIHIHTRWDGRRTTDDGRRQRNGDRDAARSYYLRCRDGYAQTKGPAHADTLDAGKLAAALA
jgi:hypothetical protein